MPVVDILGGVSNTQRLKPFQRQRVARLAKRMQNFGYSKEAISLLAKALFLTKLHDKDLWAVWRLLHPKGGTEAPLEVQQVRHLLALLSEDRDADQVGRLLDKVDANRSGDFEFEELATLLRAINPQLPRPKDIEDVDLEPHPLIEQVQAILEHDVTAILTTSAAQIERRARRAEQLAKITSELDTMYGAGASESAGKGGKSSQGRDGIDGSGAGTVSPEARRQALAMMHEVAAEQMAAAEESELRGTLECYCDDAHAHCLAMLAQALRHAADLLDGSERESYEVHVALRTVRTVEQAERLHPSKAIEWRMALKGEETQLDADEAADFAIDESTGGDGNSYGARLKSRVDAATLASFHRRRDAVSSFVNRDTDQSFRRTFDGKKSLRVSDEMRERIERVYSKTSMTPEGVSSEEPAAAVPAVGTSPSKTRGGSGESKYSRMKRLMSQESNAVKVKQEFEQGGSLSFKAREHQKNLRLDDSKARPLGMNKLRRSIILLGER